MPPDSLRARALADLTDSELEELRAHGEDSLVERKRRPPDPPKFGAAVASFANTPRGGWILIGVDDDGTVHGYTDVAPQTDLQSHLGALLRAQVDPLPPYLAAWRAIDGKQVAVMKVYESADAPHVVKGSGSVYVRTPAGKQAIDDQATLLALAQHSRDARAAAEARLTGSFIVTDALVPPDADPGRWGRGPDPENIIITVRMAPITVPPSFIEWPISSRGARDAHDAAGALFSDGPQPAEPVEPQGRGLVARHMMQTLMGEVRRATIAADSLGVIGAQFREPAPDGVVMLEGIRLSQIAPLVEAVAGLFAQAEVAGRAVADLWVSLPGDRLIYSERRPPQNRTTERMRELHASGELVLPADDDERAELARRWERELARTVGIAQWEDGD